MINYSDPLPVFVSALPPIPPAVTYTPQAVPVTFGAATLDICGKSVCTTCRTLPLTLFQMDLPP